VQLFVTVCTVDAASSTPLEQTFVLARYLTQPSATAFTDAAGCANLAVPTGTRTGIDDNPTLPSGISVSAPYPHPIANRTLLPFTLETTARFRFGLYDMLGRSVLPEVDATLAAGTHALALDLAGLQAGLYVYRIFDERGSASGQLVKVGAGSGAPASARLVSDGGAAGASRKTAGGIQRSLSLLGLRIEAQRDGYQTVVQEREVNDGARVDLPLTAITNGVPPAPILIAPVDGEQEASTATLGLVWESVENAASYTVQLSSSADFSSVDRQVEGIATPAYTLTNLDLGTIYFWRVRATGDGLTGNWSAVFDFTTESEPAPVATPVLLTPSNASTNLPTEAVGLSWTAIESASGYDVQVALSSTFTILERESNDQPGNAYVATGLSPDLTYYWRVRARNGASLGNWTTPFSFTTSDGSGALVAPTLVSPADGTEQVGIENATLAWNAVDGAKTYTIQVSTQADFSDVALQVADLTQTGYTLPTLEPGTNYYWRVQASNGTVFSAWSVAWRFTTDSAGGLAAPTLLFPAHGATGTTRDVNLQWSSVAGAATYQVQVSTSAAFNVLLFDQSGLTQTAYTVDNLAAGTTHHWRVRASDGVSTSAWSTVFDFTTQGSSSLNPPDLLAPVDGATGVDANAVDLSWAAVTGATSYHVQVSTQSSFATQVVDLDGVVGTSLALDPLAGGTAHYWRVRSEDAGTYSAWSATFDFATASSGSLEPPTLLAPQNGATGLSLSAVVLDWSDVASVASYHVQVSTSSTFATTVIDQSGLIASIYTASNLVASTTYYWRVQSVSGGSTSAWSTTFSFTTDAGGGSNEMIALDLMGPNDTYYGLKGGLVDNGTPTVTATNGKIVIVAISMSNGLQEFDRFIALYEGHQDVSTQIELVNCAVAGSALERWLTEQSLWDKCKDNVEAKHSLDQVKVIWAKNADQFTEAGITLPDPQADYYNLVNNIGALAQKIGDEFPSVQAMFNTSRIYGGYIEGEKQAARGEPISYEGGFATNAAIEKWKAGELPGAPWMGWGPYLWANGLTPNGSGIFWATSDFQGANGENQHPSEQGATKVANALHDFFMQFDWYRE
jgi:hypothetical protein